MTAVLIMLAIAVAVDIYIFGQPLHATLYAYHAILFAPPVLTVIVSCLWVSRTNGFMKLKSQKPIANLAIRNQQTNRSLWPRKKRSPF
ncbi:MAG: hypothetical protein RLY14_1509 [Planctomycetota bacterium]|jgi:hypothetical protein